MDPLDLHSGTPSAPWHRSPAVFAIGVCIVIWGAYMLAQVAILLAVGNQTLSSPWVRWIMLGTQLLIVVPLTFRLARTQPLPISELLRLRTASPGTYIAAALALIGLGILLQFLMLLLEVAILPAGWGEAYQRTRMESASLYWALLGWTSFDGLLASLLVTGVGAALSEELLFRGLVQRSMERRFRPWASIGLTSILFALVHLQPVNMLPIACIGALLGVIAWRTGSIWPSVVAHGTWNTLMVLFIDQAMQFDRQPHTGSDLLAQTPFAAAGLLLLVISLGWIFRRYLPPSNQQAYEYL